MATIVVHLTEKQTIVVGTLRSINHVSTSKVKDAKEFAPEFNDFCGGVMKSRESLVNVTACPHRPTPQRQHLIVVAKPCTNEENRSSLD